MHRGADVGGCTRYHRMTRDLAELENMQDYDGECVMVASNNPWLPVVYISKAMIVPSFSQHQVKLFSVFHKPGMMKNLLSVSQLASSGNYVVFGPNDVKVYRNLKVTSILIIVEQSIESIYVMSA